MTAAALSARAGAARVVINVVAFQVAWFACVSAAARDAAALGIGAIAAAVALHFALSSHRAADAWLTLLCIGVGIVFDTAAVRAGWIVYASPQPLEGFAPAWIVALWALLATALREPFRWMHGRRWLAALFGTVGGPLSYAAAARLGACRFDDPALSFMLLGAGWAIVMPLLAEVARRIERTGDTR